MPDSFSDPHEALPVELQHDLALWSFATFAVLLVAAVVVAVAWYRNKPTIPVFVFSTLTLIGLVTSAPLAIVCAVLLAAVILSVKLRVPQAGQS